MGDHAIDVETDEDTTNYATGPGRRRITTGPVIEVYADGAIDRHCSGCGAQPLDFCRHSDGTPRKLPCHCR